jgi:nucleotide-binding universal stress UspA family protein
MSAFRRILTRRARADLIVTGTHGRSGVSRLFMGRVAERVVRESRVPVLAVRAHTR